MVALTLVEGNEKITANIADTAEPDHPDVDDKSESDEDLPQDNGVENDTINDLKSNNKNLLSYFWNLASLDDSVRSKSVAGLLNELKNTKKVDDLNYTTQRLVKGLSSSRKAARQGFATALTHLMNEFHNITADDVMELMSKHLTVQGSFKGQEERDAYFGQLFGFLAIYRSRLQGGKEKEVQSNLVKKLVRNFLALMNKKSYLQEICGMAICDILKAIDFSIFETIKPILESILCKGWEKCTPDDLMIVLTVQSKFKDDLPKKYFKEHWNRSEILHKSNFKEMSRVLMDTSNTAHPRVHTLWDFIVEYLLSDENEDTFQTFWKVIVEEGLMHSTHERKFLAMNIVSKMASKLPSKKMQIVLGDTIIRCMINSCQSKMNYLYSCAHNVLSKLPNILVKNEDKDVIACVIKCLVGCHGHVGFDSITKTKVVDELSKHLDLNLFDYFKWLKDIFIAGTTNLDKDVSAEILEKDINECRAWVGNQLIILFRLAKGKKDESLLMEITNFLFFHGYFVSIKKHESITLIQKLPVYPVSDSTHQFFRLRFNTALTELATFNRKSSIESKSAIGGVSEDGEWFAWKILCFAKELIELTMHVTLVLTWTPEVHEAWNNSFEKMLLMKEDSKNEGTFFSEGTQLLFVHSTLQLFLNREEAVDILKELETCYQKATEKKRLNKKEPHWTEVLTEILLGFMAQSSHLMRQVVDVVYPTIVPHLTRDALDLHLKAIKPAKRNANDGIEFENESDLEEMEVTDEKSEKVESEKDEEDEDGEEGEEGEESEESEKVEKIDNDDCGEDEDNKEHVANSDESDSSDESDESDESDFEVDENFKAELKAALGDSALQIDDEDDDEEEEDGSEEEDIDMDTCDPNQLQVMDQALADVFKSRKQKKLKKKSEKDKRLSILHFKLRVLDLIEIFIKEQPKDPKILQLIEPLYEVIKSSHGHAGEQPLFERTLGIFKNKLCMLHEYPSGSDLDVDSVHDQIDHLIELAKFATSALLVTYITQGIIYLIRVLRGNPELKGPSPRATRAQRKQKDTIKVAQKVSNGGCLNEDRLMKSFKTVLVQFMTKKSSHLHPVLFVELIQRFPSLGWNLAIELPQYLNKGCNNFRKVKAFEMLKLLFSKKTDKHEQNIMDINESMCKNLIEAFKATKDESFSLKARQFHHIVNLATVYVKETSKYSKVYKKVDRDGILAAVTEALDSPVVVRSNSLRPYCQSLLVTINNAGTQTKKKRK